MSTWPYGWMWYCEGNLTLFWFRITPISVETYVFENIKCKGHAEGHCSWIPHSSLTLNTHRADPQFLPTPSFTHGSFMLYPPLSLQTFSKYSHRWKIFYPLQPLQYVSGRQRLVPHLHPVSCSALSNLKTSITWLYFTYLSWNETKVVATISGFIEKELKTA